MHHVLTLIAPPNSAKLRARASLLNQLRARLNPVRVVWLSEDACDFLLERRPAAGLMVEIAAMADTEQLDYALQPVETRPKKLFVADMDSTMIAQECIDELADCIGLKANVSAITEQAMRGELDFKDALKARVALLKGLTPADLERVYRERITPTSGATTLIATLKHFGMKTVLVSGGFTFFTSRVAEALGFDAQEANELVFENGHLSGQVMEPILDKEAKHTALLAYAKTHRAPLALTLAVGDGANDLPMLTTAGLGVAYHAKPVVEASAHARIRFNDLTALLYIQGIAKKDWVEAN